MKVYNKNFAKVKKVFSKLLVNFFQFKTTFQDRVSIYEDERIQQNEDQSYTTALSTTDGSGIEDKKLGKMEKVLYKLELMSDRLNDIADEYFEDIFDIEAGDCKSVNTANSSNRQLSTFFDNISYLKMINDTLHHFITHPSMNGPCSTMIPSFYILELLFISLAY